MCGSSIQDAGVTENFSSVLKTKYIFCHKPPTFSQSNELSDRYIYFYDPGRIQQKRERRGGGGGPGPKIKN